MTSVSCLKNGCKLCCDIEGCVINNGWMSDCIKIERGVRQGCPLSPYLFVLSVEVLANAIRRDPSIKGISISQNDVKLSQYADDTTLILVDGSKDVLDTSLGVIETFSRYLVSDFITKKNRRFMDRLKDEKLRTFVSR